MLKGLLIIEDVKTAILVAFLAARIKLLDLNYYIIIKGVPSEECRIICDYLRIYVEIYEEECEMPRFFKAVASRVFGVVVSAAEAP